MNSLVNQIMSFIIAWLSANLEEKQIPRLLLWLSIIVILLWLQVNEKGLLSFRGTFSSSPIRDFSFSHSQPLIAPLWTDLHSRQGGEIFYRMSTDPDTLQRAKNLTKKHFLTVNFQPINIIIVTWYQVPHESIGNPQLVRKEHFNNFWKYVLASLLHAGEHISSGFGV